MTRFSSQSTDPKKWDNMATGMKCVVTGVLLLVLSLIPFLGMLGWVGVPFILIGLFFCISVPHTILRIWVSLAIVTYGVVFWAQIEMWNAISSGNMFEYQMVSIAWQMVGFALLTLMARSIGVALGDRMLVQRVHRLMAFFVLLVVGSIAAFMVQQPGALIFFLLALLAGWLCLVIWYYRIMRDAASAVEGFTQVGGGGGRPFGRAQALGMGVTHDPVLPMRDRPQAIDAAPPSVLGQAIPLPLKPGEQRSAPKPPNPFFSPKPQDRDQGMS